MALFTQQESRILTILILSGTLSACSVPQGFKFATLEDQVNNAGAIVEATAGKNFAEDKVNFGLIKFNDVRFLKGCGPEQITVEGFKNSAACGAGIPSVGDKVVLFLCKGSDETNWKINDFSVSTGVVFLKYKKNSLSRVRNLVLSKFGSLGKCSTLSKCKNGKKKPVVGPPKGNGGKSNVTDESEKSTELCDNMVKNSLKDFDLEDAKSLLNISELSEISNLSDHPLDSNINNPKVNNLKNKLDKIKKLFPVAIGDTK